MSTLYKRGAVFHYDANVGGRRLRISLGTEDKTVAKILNRQIEVALAEGDRSETWETLRHVLPASSFMVLTRGLKVKASALLTEFQKHYDARMDSREILGEITPGTRRKHQTLSEIFFKWARQRVRLMDEISPQLLSEYLVWRKTEVTSRGFTGRGLDTDNSVLSGIFKIAVEDEVLSSSPFRQRFQIEAEAREVLPFSREELDRMAQHTNYENRLAFLIFRWTGLRISDVENLRWSSVNFGTKTIRVVARKNKKEAVIPVVEELRAELWKRRCSDPYAEQVLPDWNTNRLYKLVKNLGKLAGVENAHPHRFRHSLATELLAGGASLWDVSKVLGDSAQVVEKHYGHLTDGHRDRMRTALDKIAG